MNKKYLLFLGLFIGSVICFFLILIILSIPEFFEFNWNQALRDTFIGADLFFQIITELGGTIIYFAFFLVIYWAINKQAARGLLLVYAASDFVNYYAKSIIANERPPKSEWLAGASHLSTPSGHAMSSSVYWGYTAMKAKRWWTTILCVLIIILVGLSRMYLGVHWFGDILTGWLFAFIILSTAWMIGEYLQKFYSEKNLILFYIGLALFGFIFLIITQLLFPSQEHNFGSSAGKMIGLGVGSVLELKYVKFDINPSSGKKWHLILRILFGLIMVGGIFLVLYLVIPQSIFWLVAIQYIVVLVIGIFLWPLIFKKLRI